FLAPVSYPAGNGANGVAVADVNGDGREDVVVADITDSKVAVLLGNGDGTLQAPVFYPTGTNPYGVAVGDLNGDGKPDIVTANYTPPNLASVLLNNGDGTFGPAKGFGPVGQGVSAAAIGDVDGDHVPDVAVAGWNDEHVYAFHGN